MLYTLYRRGTFRANFSTVENKCGSESQQTFRYTCIINVRGGLDARGFVMDNLAVQTYFRNEYGRRQRAKSCEKIAEDAVVEMLAGMRGKDVQFVRVGISGGSEALLVAEWRKGDEIEETRSGQAESEDAGEGERVDVGDEVWTVR